MVDVIGGAQAFKHSAVGILREYFLSADTAEVATALTELGKPDLHHIFVKQVRAPPQRSWHVVVLEMFTLCVLSRVLWCACVRYCLLLAHIRPVKDQVRCVHIMSHFSCMPACDGLGVPCPSVIHVACDITAALARPRNEAGDMCPCNV